MLPEPTYLLLQLDPPPARIDAPQNRKEGYRWKFGETSLARMEINFLQEGSMTVCREDGEHTFPEGCVHTLLHEPGLELYSDSPVMQEFYMTFAPAERPQPISAEEAAAWVNKVHCAILPEYITDHAACQHIGSLLKNANKLIICRDMVRSLKLRAIMYECLSVLTEQAVLQAREHLRRAAHSLSAYTRKAQQFINANLHRRLTVAEIAAHVGISYDHLNRVFRQDVNMTLLEYANRARIRRVEQYITVDGLTLEKAGDLVGIQDTKYLSRLFHRCTGISASDYRRIYRERKEV